MGSTSEKVNSAITRLKTKFIFWDMDGKEDDADLSLGGGGQIAWLRGGKGGMIWKACGDAWDACWVL